MRALVILGAFAAVSVCAPAASAAPTPWWMRTDLGPPDPKGALAAMWTPTIDDAVGAGGLRLSSTGSGVAATHPVIALGHAPRTIGAGDGIADLDAFDRRGRLAEHAAAKVAEVERHLPPDVIQRVVHDNEGRFASCYDIGRRTNPELRGRVVVKFVIDRVGTVAFAADVGSELPDVGVVACVVRAFDTLTFPEGTDRLVTVVYPLVFAPPVGP